VVAEREAYFKELIIGLGVINTVKTEDQVFVYIPTDAGKKDLF
jgi:hypothetical protein